MSAKRCSYRNCNSFTNASNPSPLTFFAFPKHPARYQLWMKLGGCQDGVTIGPRYFCSKHFDESKYIAQNQRRKQLLGTAVPWPYDQSPQREMVSDEVDYQCVVSTIEDNDADDNVSIERFQDETVSVEVHNESLADSIEEELQSYEYNVEDNKDFIISLNKEKKTLKRKHDNSSKQHLESNASDSDTGLSDQIVQLSNRPTSSTINMTKETPVKESKLAVYDEKKLTESRNLTTFIYKGEEYIQMPKDDYVNERLTLMQKLKVYEDILRNVKHLVDEVKF